MKPLCFYAKISEYRLELMGFAMLEVLIGHIYSLSGANSPALIHVFVSLLYTRAFLFISGYSMYHSISKGGYFYEKRLFRVYIPYLIMTLPFFLFVYSTDSQNLIPFGAKPMCGLLSLIGEITTLGYWIEGNIAGMWYISLTLLLYFFVKMLYRYEKKYPPLHLLVCILLFLLSIKWCLYFIDNTYYESIKLALNQAAFFPLGFIVAQMIRNKNSISWVEFSIIGITISCITYQNIVTYVSLPCMAVCFDLLSKRKSFSIYAQILRFLGRNSLEIYVLHLILFAFIIVVEKRISIEVPYIYNIGSTLLLTAILISPVRSLAEIIKNKYYELCTVRK